MAAAALLLASCGGHSMQGTSSASVAVTVPWTLPGGCSTQSCVASVYRSAGGCAVTGSVWTLVAKTAAGATSFVDGNIVAGATYSYDVELSNGALAQPDWSGPSNCVTYGGTP